MLTKFRTKVQKAEKSLWIFIPGEIIDKERIEEGEYVYVSLTKHRD